MKLLIVEDEIHIARLLEKKISLILEDQVTSMETISTYDQAIQYLESHEIDVLMLDLNLNGRDGFELLKFFSAGPYQTIVVSAHQERAIEAFEYGVIDFVLKPFNEARLKKAFNRVNKLDIAGQPMTKYFATQRRGQLRIVEDDEILYFQAYGHYSKIHLRNGDVELHNKSLVQLLPLLPKSYERIHKSFILKMSEANKLYIHEGGKYQIQINNGELLPLGRKRYPSIKDKWFQ